MAIRSINKITLMGHLGKQPELIVTPKADGGEVKRVSTRLATNESIPDGNGGYIQETDWHNLVFWGRDAEIISQYGSTKTPIYVEGTVKNRSYEKNGQTFYVSEVRVNEFIMLGSKPENNEPMNSQAQGNQQNYQQQAMPQGQPQQAMPQGQPQQTAPYQGQQAQQPYVQQAVQQNSQQQVTGQTAQQASPQFDVDEPPY